MCARTITEKYSPTRNLKCRSAAMHRIAPARSVSGSNSTARPGGRRIKNVGNSLTAADNVPSSFSRTPTPKRRPVLCSSSRPGAISRPQSNYRDAYIRHLEETKNARAMLVWYISDGCWTPTRCEDRQRKIGAVISFFNKNREIALSQRGVAETDNCCYHNSCHLPDRHSAFIHQSSCFDHDIAHNFTILPVSRRLNSQAR